MMLHRFLIALAILFVAFGCAAHSKTRPIAAVATKPWDKPGWTLTFHDEFDGPTINKDVWADRFSVVPSYYVFENGILHLRMTGDMPPHGGPAGKNKRISGIDSRNTPKAFSQKYGWFEVRAKCCKGTGMACTFWLAPADRNYQQVKAYGGTRFSPLEGNEIDVFEQQGNDPTGNNFTVHFGDERNFHGSSARHTRFPFDLTADFHVYALEWDENKVVWYLDGKAVHRAPNPPQSPFFLRLGLYESDNDWSGKIDPNQPYPKDFDIDYVRVYKKNQP